MVGRELLVSISLINPFGTSIIDQHFRESIKLIGFCCNSLLICYFPEIISISKKIGPNILKRLLIFNPLSIKIAMTLMNLSA